MIAELHSKISPSGSNLHDRLEDQLTGDVFGSLRYIAFETGLYKLLAEMKGLDKEYILPIIKNLNWNNTEIVFWRRFNDGEPDILLISDEIVICIEVKYNSGLSSDDGADFSENEGDNENEIEDKKELEYSQHQLHRESQILIKEFAKKKYKILLLIADELACCSIYLNTETRKLIKQDVMLGYLSWQDILEVMNNYEYKKLPSDNIVLDIKNLLYKKGFERFKTFIYNKKINNIDKEGYYDF